MSTQDQNRSTTTMALMWNVNKWIYIYVFVFTHFSLSVTEKSTYQHLMSVVNGPHESIVL